eukprot:695451-Pelagomonas_calceolata.AAC.1
MQCERAKIIQGGRARVMQGTAGSALQQCLHMGGWTKRACDFGGLAATSMPICCTSVDLGCEMCHMYPGELSLHRGAYPFLCTGYASL